MNKLLRTGLLLAAVAAGLGQNEDEPYFTLSSSRTFASNSKPNVSVSAWNIDSLEFRVYRINDPVKFFQQLEDAHQFGGRVPRPTNEPTLIERIHEWKRGIRANVRRTLRAQFTESPSAHFASVLPRSSAPPSRVTKFAEAHVLNSQQLAI